MSHYRTTGLAEINPHPSELTLTYLQSWFRGDNSPARAAELLHIPYSPCPQPLLTMHEDQLAEDLQVEEAIYYQRTIFSYGRSFTRLHVSPFKLLNPFKWPDSFKLLQIQTQWIMHPQKYLKLHQKLLQNAQKTKNTNPNQILEDELWPLAIAVGMMAEFYDQLLKSHTDTAEYLQLQQHIDHQVASHDWFYQSIAQQSLIAQGKLSLKQYIQEFGLRADNDYELTSPRWYEQPHRVMDRVRKLKPTTTPTNDDISIKNSNQTTVQTIIQYRILRSQVRKQILVAMDKLRQQLFENGQLPKSTNFLRQYQVHQPQPELTSGKGTPVSPGISTGKIKHITNSTQSIPQQTIGIFPNASPEFTQQFPQCIGLIFLAGGMSSHGAIVAREFGIPAIIEPQAKHISDKAKLQLNGTTGKWQVLQ